jgi:hypothetical protein
MPDTLSVFIKTITMNMLLVLPLTADPGSNWFVFGLVVMWVLAVTLWITVTSWRSNESMRAMIQQHRARPYQWLHVLHYALWDVPIVWFIVKGGHPVLAALYALGHAWRH